MKSYWRLESKSDPTWNAHGEIEKDDTLDCKVAYGVMHWTLVQKCYTLIGPEPLDLMSSWGRNYPDPFVYYCAPTVDLSSGE